MGTVDFYHVTMVLRTEEEFAIRSLFKDKNWTCYLKVLSEETVADIIESGFTNLFPTLDSEQSLYNELLGESKTNNIDEDYCSNNSNSVVMESDDYVSDVDDRLESKINDRAKKLPARKSSRRKVLVFENSDKKQNNGRNKRRGRRKTQEPADVTLSVYNVQCIDCGLKFQSREDFWFHRNLAKHELPTVNIPTKFNLGLYSKEEHERMGFIKCDGCDNYFLGKRRQMKHFYVVHRDLMPTPTCPICCKEFKYYAELLKHKREEGHQDSLSSLKNYQCDLCGKHMTSYSNFVQHKQFICGISEKEMEKIRIHDCHLCGKLFKSPRHVRRHKKISHFKEPEMCDICGTLCQGRKALDVHKKRHDERNKKHVCDDCGKAFFSDSKLQEHIRTHTKEKPFKCPLCTYTCAVKPNIQKHATNVHKQTVTAVDLRKIPVSDGKIVSENASGVKELDKNLQENGKTLACLKTAHGDHVNNEITERLSQNDYPTSFQFKTNSNILNVGKMITDTDGKNQLSTEEMNMSTAMTQTNNMASVIPHKNNLNSYNENGVNVNMQIDCNGSDIVYYSERGERRADFIAFPHSDMYNVNQY